MTSDHVLFKTWQFKSLGVKKMGEGGGVTSMKHEAQAQFLNILELQTWHSVLNLVKVTERERFEMKTWKPGKSLTNMVAMTISVTYRANISKMWKFTLYSICNYPYLYRLMYTSIHICTDLANYGNNICKNFMASWAEDIINQEKMNYCKSVHFYFSVCMYSRNSATFSSPHCRYLWLVEW